MAKLLGKAPNQVPTNADLGTMAFQDREGINVNNAIVANLVVTGATSVNATFAVTNASSNVLFVSANGNVGIGNNTPSFKMVVDGGAATTTSVVRSTSGYAELFLSGTTASYLSSNTSLNVWANGATRMFVAANGNIGINNTAPVNILSVAGNTYIDGERIFLYSATANTGAFLQFYTANTSSFVGSRFLHPGANLAFDAGYDTGAQVYYVNRFDNAGTFVDRSFMIGRANGNVGIANASPDAKLTVTGTANISANVWIGGSATIAGNLTVSGTTTYINTTTLNVGDNIITLNADVSGTPSENAGIEVNRGTSANTQFIWNEGRGRWGAYLAGNGTSTIEAYGNNAAFRVIATGNSTSNTIVAIDASVDTSTMLLDSSNSISAAALTTRIDLKSPDYRGSGVYVTQTTAPIGGANAYWFVGKPYTGGAFQIGFGVSPEYQSNAVFQVSGTNTNIGIGNSFAGTSFPIDVLHVRRDSASNTGIVIQNRNASGIASLKFLTGAIDITDTRYSEIVSSGGTSSTLTFRTSNGATPADVMFLAANGNVGIANTLPAYKLSVGGSVRFDSVVSIGGSQKVSIDAPNISDGRFVVTTDPTGNGTNGSPNANVGIGIVSPTAKLHVNGSVNLVGPLTLGSNTTFNGNTITYNGTNTSITMRVVENGVLSFEGGAGQLFSIANSLTGQLFAVNDISGIPSMEVYSNGQVNIAKFSGNVSIGSNTATIATTGVVQFSNSSAVVAYAAANGNVGIANAVPTHKLSVNGTTYVGGILTLASGLNANGSVGTAGQVLISNGTATYWGAASAGAAAAAGTNTQVQFNLSGTTTGANIYYVAGNTGFGNSTPDATLKVTGTANVSGNTQFSANVFVAGNLGIGNNTSNYKLLVDGGSAWFKPNNTGANTDVLYLGRFSDNDSPAFVLRTDDATADSLEFLSARYNANFRWRRNSGVGERNVAILNSNETLGTEFLIYHHETDNTAKVQLSTRGDSYINATANVGIGTSTPNAKFHVVGTANVSGNVAFGQDVSIAGNLTVSGTTTYINTTTLDVGDNIITLNADVTSGTAPTENQGLLFNRGSSPNTSFLWDESGDRFLMDVGNDANSAFRIQSNTYAHGTDMVAGGLTTYWGTPSLPYTYATFNVASGVNKLRTYTRDYLIANTGSDLFMVAANGNIGIGNTAPTVALQVTTTATAAAGATIARFGTASDAGRIRIIDENTTGALPPMITSPSAAYGLGIAADHAGNGAPIMFYLGGTANTTNERARFIANGNFGIGNTAPTDKLVVAGNITATGNITSTGSLAGNNLKRIALTRTLSTTVNDTVDIGTFTSTVGGVQDLIIAIQVSDSGFSVAKQYHIVSAYHATAGTTYRRVLPLYDTGPFSNDFELEAYHNFDDLVLRLRRSVGSSAGTAEILIDDLVINSGTDSFTPSTATASAVAAVTDLYPGNRLLNTGGNHGTPNTFIVQANLTTAAITSNNTQTVFNLPLSFNGGYTTTGTAGTTSINFTTSTTTANQVVSTGVGLGSSAWRTVKYLVSVTSGSAYQATEILIIHDGTNVYKTEYGTVYSAGVLATFDADINSGSIRLLTTPTNAVTTYKGAVTFVST